MEIGVTLPQAVGDAGALVATARRAAALGFGSVWVGDGPGGLDPLVALGTLARATAGVRLGVLLDASRRPPALVAKALASADRLSGGRVVAAAGLVAGDDDALGALDEALRVLAGVLGSDGEPFAFAGRHHAVDGARCLPGPVQRPRPPVWAAGAGLAEVAAQAADGWVTGWADRLDALRPGLAALDEACARHGRDPATVARALALVDPPAADLDRARAEAGPAATVLAAPAGGPFAALAGGELEFLAARGSLGP